MYHILAANFPLKISISTVVIKYMYAYQTVAFNRSTVVEGYVNTVIQYLPTNFATTNLN